MTTAQLNLMLRLIAADRAYWIARVTGAPCTWWDRGVEVGLINGVHPNTAECLEAAGLAESVAGVNGHPYLFLSTYDPDAPAAVGAGRTCP